MTNNHLNVFRVMEIFQSLQVQQLDLDQRLQVEIFLAANIIGELRHNIALSDVSTAIFTGSADWLVCHHC